MCGHLGALCSVHTVDWCVVADWNIIHVKWIKSKCINSIICLYFCDTTLLNLLDWHRLSNSTYLPQCVLYLVETSNAMALWTGAAASHTDSLHECFLQNMSRYLMKCSREKESESWKRWKHYETLNTTKEYIYNYVQCYIKSRGEPKWEMRTRTEPGASLHSASWAPPCLPSKNPVKSASDPNQLCPVRKAVCTWPSTCS